MTKHILIERNAYKKCRKSKEKREKLTQYNVEWSNNYAFKNYKIFWYCKPYSMMIELYLLKY